MLIDWMTLKCSTDLLDAATLQAYQSTQDRLLKIAGDGTVVWESCAWESVRSDSHQVAFQVTNNHIRIQGSPARLVGDGDNVFSSGAPAALDLVGCFQRFVMFVAEHVKLSLPLNPSCWSVTRVDVTSNLFLDSLPAVRQALSILSGCEGGRYRVSNKSGSSVYWSSSSRLRKGKAYAKGPELEHKMRMVSKSRLEHPIRFYSPDELLMAEGLLRLELTLGAQFWRERVGLPWHEVTPEFLKAEWESYFLRMIGGADMTQTENIYERLLKVVPLNDNGQPKEGQAKAAYSLWSLITSQGWEKTHSMTSKATWYRNLKLLRAAGLSDADLSAGKIVQFRQKILEAKPVHSWSELEQVYLLKAA